LDVFHTNPLPLATHGVPGNFYIVPADTVPMVIGYFENQKKNPYVLLVNRNFTSGKNIPVTFSDSVYSVIEISKQTGNELPALVQDLNNQIILEFKAGEGRLFRIVKKYMHIRLATDTIYIRPEANSSISFNIISNIRWSINSDKDWLTLNKVSFGDSTNVSLTTSKNNLKLPRTSIITISDDSRIFRTITIVQNYDTCTYITLRPTDTIILYPNPTTEMISVSLPKSWMGARINIYSSDGNKIYTLEPTDRTFEINISSFPKGNYIINFKLRNLSFTKEIIKQ
jgi:hypothetical protein